LNQVRMTFSICPLGIWSLEFEIWDLLNVEPYPVFTIINRIILFL
jgi:hypothetical protein